MAYVIRRVNFNFSVPLGATIRLVLRLTLLCFVICSFLPPDYFATCSDAKSLTHAAEIP